MLTNINNSAKFNTGEINLKSKKLLRSLKMLQILIKFLKMLIAGCRKMEAQKKSLKDIDNLFLILLMFLNLFYLI